MEGKLVFLWHCDFGQRDEEKGWAEFYFVGGMEIKPAEEKTAIKVGLSAVHLFPTLQIVIRMNSEHMECGLLTGSS
jgi:hypothetical protein